MKFGSYLEAHKFEKWREFYIDYKKLDEMIRALSLVENAGLQIDTGRSGYGERVTSMSTTPNPDLTTIFRGENITESDFFAALEQEILKIGNFVNEELAAVQKRIEDIVMACKDAYEGGYSADERDELSRQATDLGEEFLRIEKFANHNLIGFHKILKKHDRQLPATPCQKFYLTRLHQESWVSADFSRLFLSLNQAHALLRGEETTVPSGAENFFGSKGNLERILTQRFWVHTEDVSAVKHKLLQHLTMMKPWGHDHHEDAEEDALYDSRPSHAVYLDNQKLELYHSQTEKPDEEEAVEIFLRWFGKKGPKDRVYVERRTIVKNSHGSIASKQHFTLMPYQVIPFARGQFKPKDYERHLEMEHASLEEIESAVQLFSEIQKIIDSKQLGPTLRVISDRVRFGDSSSDNITVSLDSGVQMFCEDHTKNGTVFSRDRWYRKSIASLAPNEITNFPYCVMEVNVMGVDENEDAFVKYEWLEDLINTGCLTLVKDFSPYIHGCAALMPNEVQVLPYWIDDDGIQQSIPSSNIFGCSNVDALSHIRREEMKMPGNGQASDTTSANLVSGNKRSNYGAIEHGSEEETKSLLASGLRSINKRSGATYLYCLPRLFQNLFFCRDLDDVIPLKVEPKLFLANERMLINWLQMAVTLASIAIGLFGVTSGPKESFSNGERLAHITGMILLPVSVLFCGYALASFYWRGKRIRYRQEVYQDERGSLFLGAVVAVASTAIFTLNLSLTP